MHYVELKENLVVNGSYFEETAWNVLLEMLYVVKFRMWFTSGHILLSHSVVLLFLSLS